MEHFPRFNETPKPTPEQNLDYEVLFTRFSIKDIISLSIYQEEMIDSVEGVVKLTLDPISEEFIDKFPDDFKLLEKNRDEYDDILTPSGEDLEDLIAEDKIIQALVKAIYISNKLENSDLLSLSMSLLDKEKLNGSLSISCEAYTNALWIRRSVLAFKLQQDIGSVLVSNTNEVSLSEDHQYETILLNNTNLSQDNKHIGPENLGRSA